MPRELNDLINIKRAIVNFIIALTFGIIIPVICFSFLIQLFNPLGDIFDYNLIILNGILFIIVYTMFGLFKKETIMRLFIGIGYIALLIYFYTIGSCIFTLYLPHCAFGELCLSGNLLGIEISFTYNYVWSIVILLILKSLNLLRHKIKPVEEEETYELKELK